MELGSIEARFSREGQECLDAQSSMQEVELQTVAVEMPAQLIDPLEKSPPESRVQLRYRASASGLSTQEIFESGLKSHLDSCDVNPLGSIEKAGGNRMQAGSPLSMVTVAVQSSAGPSLLIGSVNFSNHLVRHRRIDESD
jgi:hypothetical protein